MAADFRSLLEEDSRNAETGERWFKDLELDGVFFFSVQASSIHASKPEALLDDLAGYEAWQVTLQTMPRVFTDGRRGAWQYVEEKPWWPLFTDDSPIQYIGENVPTATVQQVYEDLLAVVAAHPELKPRKCGGLKAC